MIPGVKAGERKQAEYLLATFRKKHYNAAITIDYNKKYNIGSQGDFNG